MFDLSDTSMEIPSKNACFEEVDFFHNEVRFIRL